MTRSATFSALRLPYRWFANIIVLREKRGMAFPAVFGVVCFVAFARSELEILTTQTATYDAIAVINNIAFYLQSVYVYALLASLLTGKSLKQVSGIVVIGVYLGIFPPLLDILLGGLDTGHYRYVTDGLSRWSWTLLNPEHYSTGEAVTLWLLTTVLALYVLETTRSWSRGLLALALSYATVVFIAMAPSTFAAWVVTDASPFPPGAMLVALTLLQILIAQLVYAANRPSLARRLLPRMLHGMPFAALVLLGGAVSEFFSPSGLSHTERTRFAVVTVLLMLELCAVALVQNDAFDARKDGRSEATVTLDDAYFFTTTGILVVLCAMITLPGLGLPMALFLCVSTLYSFDFYRAKNFFPANYKSEGIWGWSAFLLGGCTQLSVAPVRTVSAGFLGAGLVVFGAWSLFNVFKDYKDIRSDFKARHQTLYVLALRRNIKLRTLHRGLRNLLIACLAIPLVLLCVAGVDALGVAVITGCAGVSLFWILGGPPKKRTVMLFLLATTAYVFALAGLIEHQLRS